MSPVPYQSAIYGFFYYVPAFAFVDADGTGMLSPPYPTTCSSNQTTAEY
jgi:hypothetical protein